MLIFLLHNTQNFFYSLTVSSAETVCQEMATNTIAMNNVVFIFTRINNYNLFDYFKSSISTERMFEFSSRKYSETSYSQTSLKCKIIRTRNSRNGLKVKSIRWHSKYQFKLAKKKIPNNYRVFEIYLRIVNVKYHEEHD